MAEVVEDLGTTSTANDVLSGLNLRAKRILVTGVSAGLGVETARSLAHGAHVVGAARDLAKAETAAAHVRTDATSNGGSFELVELDLANLKSVRACADKLLAEGEPFDAVIANAGVMAPLDVATVEQLTGLVRIDIVALTRLAMALLPGFKSGNQGAIVNIGCQL